MTGLVRAPEERNFFTPADEPARKTWFARDPQAIASGQRSRTRRAVLCRGGRAPNPGGWPKGGQTQLNLPEQPPAIRLHLVRHRADAGRRLRRVRLAQASRRDDLELEQHEKSEA